MLKRMNLSLLLVLLSATSVGVLARDAGSSLHAKRFEARFVLLHPVADGVNDREQDGLVGSVRRVRTETAKLLSKEGKLVEGPRVVLETATYDIKGAKIDTAYFLAAGGSLTGKEVYKYDDKGNIIEMSLHRDDGSLASKEVYTYEFDAVGNWTKMTTSVAIVEGGKVTFEPTEVTYRAIAYYMEEATVNKLSQPTASSAASTTNSAPPANVAVAQTANVRPASASSASSTPASAPAAMTSAPASKGSAFVPAASTPNVSPNVLPAASNKKSSSVVAPPELAAVDNKVYAVVSPSVGNVKSAVESGNSGAPQVKVEGEAPARPLAKGPLKPISGGVLNGKALSLPSPFYPEVAKRIRAAGVVTVEVVIDVTGKVISAKATGGPEVLHQSAEKAAMQARFSPTLLSGQPVKISGTINYNFALSN
ncbi:MAG TPA: TonB family protein [Pyrinomonadaceae bacterium]|jgi:protein TonB